ncbi:MAG: translation initiation factor IF-2 N-terminal domain-containing protein, partial [Pseudomonadota bacterium]|nr:translation initiation factor IF-2 N-terminal domain-containing protein [Pseudomonadota bacterium]
MAEKTVKELAQMVQKPVEKLLEQLADAGLPQRNADSVISEAEQEQLVSHLQRSHGQQTGNTKITFK